MTESDADQTLDRLFKLSELKQSLEDRKQPFTISDLQQVQNLETKNQLVEYLADKLKSDILLRMNEMSDERILSSTSILPSLIKSGKFNQPEIQLKVMEQQVVKNHDKDRLNTILVVKAILKHSNPTENVFSIIEEYLRTRVNPIETILSSPKNIDFYLLNKYFRCVKLCLIRESFNTNALFETTLNRLIESHADLASLETRPFENLATKHAVVNLLELVVYLSIYSTDDLAPDRLDLLKSILVSRQSNDEHFRPDIIYSDVVDDSQQIEFNLTCLERRLLVLNKNQPQTITNTARFLFDFYLHPTRLFWKLVSSSVGFDCELVVEWLISSETKFLVYFLKFLKYLYADLLLLNENRLEYLERSLSRTNDHNSSAKLVSFLADVNAKLSSLKRSFPYNCTPLLKLLANILDKLK